MLIGDKSKYLLKKVRAKAKMIEYSVPEELHAEIEEEIEEIFITVVGIIADISREIIENRKDSIECEKKIEEYKENLFFSSSYLDSYFNSKLKEKIDNYQLLLGSIAYYLCDYIGSSKVLIKKIDIKTIDLNSNSLEKMIYFLLNDEFDKVDIKNYDSVYQEDLLKFQGFIKIIYKNETIEKESKKIISEMRKNYFNGTDLEFFLGEAFIAIYILKISRSSNILLPIYMSEPKDKIKDLFRNEAMIKELWPSQRLLGKQNIFNGHSGIIQMPTSSGKTKSIFLMISSFFLKNNIGCAVVVAPFKALCYEIKTELKKSFLYDDKVIIDELSDVLQDEELELNYSENKNIIISTPEKLLYLIRKNENLAKKIGLIIFDEAHLFDEPIRGITYELLISALKKELMEDVQKVLISAVISNVEDLNEWFNDGKGKIVSSDVGIIPKNIGVTNILYDKKINEKTGYLYFIKENGPDGEAEFFVPRILKIQELNKKEREIKKRMFPELDSRKEIEKSRDIGIYYSLNLCHNGAVVLFSGTKKSANKILERIIEIDERGYNVSKFSEYSDSEEVEKISYLIKEHYGEESLYYKASLKSIFVHHSEINNGLKNSIEHAMKHNKINFLVCTSTLAQGVNLPIRYLIITGIRQGRNEIKVRDFQNLIGRAGRAGVYTEGTVLITEGYKNSKWQNYKRLINKNNSEPCKSRLLLLVEEILTNCFPINDSWVIYVAGIIKEYYLSEKRYSIKKIFEDICNEKEVDYNRFEEKVSELNESLERVESFITEYQLSENTINIDEIENALKSTYAYFLADEKQKKELLEIFRLISDYCMDKLPNLNQKYACMRSLMGVDKILYIEEWLGTNDFINEEISSSEEMLSKLLPCIIYILDEKIIQSISEENFLEILILWISGVTYKEIYQKKIKDLQENEISLEKICKICEQISSYKITNILSAIGEALLIKLEENDWRLKMLNYLINQMKYGLKNIEEIYIYEIGFNDRVVAKNINKYLVENEEEIYSKQDSILKIRKNKKDLRKVLEKYPIIFMDKLNKI